MAQTRDGAAKVAAAKLGMDLAGYQQKIVAEKWCTKGKHWQSRTSFSKDSSRADGLATKCHACIRVENPYSSLVGRTSTFKGKTHSVEAKAKQSAAAKARPSNRLGKRHSPESRAKISQATKERAARGEAHYAYTDGQHQRDKEMRRTTEYAAWRLAVFTRDEFQCQQCGDSKGGNLQAHHKKPYADFPDLRLDVSNGLTLCQNCHEQMHLKPIPVARVRRKKHPLPAPLLEG